MTSALVRAEEPPPAAAPTPAPASPAPAEIKLRSIVVLRHSLRDPALAISPEQQQMLDEVDQRLADPIAGNPITASPGTTIESNDGVQRKIEELQIGDRMGDNRVAQKLACALGADTVLRVEVISVEGPLRDSGGTPPAPVVVPSDPTAPPALTPPGKSKGKKKGDKPEELVKEKVVEHTPAPVPAAADGPAKWSVKYRLTLLPSEGGSGPEPEEIELTQEKASGIKTQVGTVAARMLERVDEVRRGRRRIGTIGGIAAVALGAGAAGLGGWLISIHHQPLTTPVPPKELSPERYNTLPGGIAAIAVGAVGIVGGVAAILYGQGVIGSSKCGAPTPSGGWITPGGGGVSFAGCF